jgi:hypothetical protein
MQRDMAERLEEAFEYSAIWHLEKTECGDELTDEENRNVKTFHALRDSVKDIPPELMQRTSDLARKHPGARYLERLAGPISIIPCLNVKRS